jgi:predicted acetyltransferase/GNAT superfamily N-acetyltransferase
MSVTVRMLDRRNAVVTREQLADLLVDAVKNGASVGFLWPLDRVAVAEYWKQACASIGEDFSLWVAEDDAGRIVGSVQLDRCRKQNGRHRAEVQKLFVHSECRGRGISSQLLAAAEAHARGIGCSLLVLDTEAGSLAESVYQHLGWRKAGEIPMYAGKPSGELIPTAYHYKLIGPAPPELQLVTPAREHLASHVAVLKTGWHANNMRRDEAAREALEEIEKNADAYLARQIDREAKGPPVKLPDGSEWPRIPGYVLWMWDGEYCGSIGFRWVPGTTELPTHVLGHIGYGVVPWKRQRGYATRALALMLERVRAEGLAHVEITCDPDNVASQRTIVANGGVLVDRFMPPPACGPMEKLRYRIAIPS